MSESWLHRLDMWRDFYIFTGTAAATLMGLMFVVVSLGRGILGRDEGGSAIRAFFTPVVAFFTTMIVVSMFMLIPRSTPGVLGVLLICVALSGLSYMFASGAHTRWRESELAFDDWVWYVALPFVSYLTVGAAGAGIWSLSAFGPYALAAAMVLLLLVGIRNAWDLVVYTSQHTGE